MSEQDRVAIVTGASRGIGRSIANRLASDGIEVIGTATTEAGADTITETLSLNGAGPDGKGYVLDVSQSDSIDAFFEAVKANHGAPLILVNNAGITRDNLSLRMKEEEWQAVLDTNLGSIYRMVKNCLRAMTKARWGRIINISSVVARMGNAGQSNYAAAKAGMEGYSRALASVLGSRSITVNCVAPGFIETDMTRELSDAQSAAMLERIPIARLGAADEVAALVAFLAGDESGYITGETVHINGGLYMN